MIVVSAANANAGARYSIFKLMQTLNPKHECDEADRELQSRFHYPIASKEATFHQRRILICAGASLAATLSFNNGFLTTLPALAENKIADEEDGEGMMGMFNTMFDPNEKTKSGKLLPKAYLKSAREVVKTLRESLNEDPKDNAKFRRTADAAKESIRDYLSNWRGQGKIAEEESYVELEQVIRKLAMFYSKAGPSAALPVEVKSEILNDLNRAEEYL